MTSSLKNQSHGSGYQISIKGKQKSLPSSSLDDKGNLTLKMTSSYKNQSHCLGDQILKNTEDLSPAAPSEIDDIELIFFSDQGNIQPKLDPRPDSYFMKKSLDYLGVKQVAGPYKWFNLEGVLLLSKIHVHHEVTWKDVIDSIHGPPRDILFRPSDGNRAYSNHIQDKYLLLCLVSLPLPPYVHKELKKIFKLYPKLVSLAGGAFEMVIVADTCSQDDYNNFFTRDFPGVTLPFSDPHTGPLLDKLRSSLSLTLTKSDPLVGLILDPTHLILQKDYCGTCFAELGASFFPFTYDRVKDLVDTEEAIIARSSFPDTDNPRLERFVSLADLLCCEPSLVLHRIGGGGDKITVEELSRKDCVGVYFCVNGMYMSELAMKYNEFHKVREDGSKDERVFEIVMVHLCNMYDEEALARIEPELRNASSWWEFPYNNETTLRLKRVCRTRLEESLKIVRPGRMFWEYSGKAVLRSDGIASHPFTMESFLERMTTVTVDSLLGGCSQTLVKLEDAYKNHRNKKHTVGNQFRGKNVMVYFDYPGCMNTGAWKSVRDAYHKRDRCMFEVVFVPMYTTSYDDPDLKYCVRKMPSSWFMLLPQFVNTLGLYTATEGYKADTVAFGEDGKIRTKCAAFYIREPGGIATLFAEDLHPVESERMLEDVLTHFQEIKRSQETFF